MPNPMPSYRPARDRVLPAVVHIVTIASSSPISGAAATIKEESGTGFLVRVDPSWSYIVTARHVVQHVLSADPPELRRRLLITRTDGTPLQATALQFVPAPGADLAVIQVASQPGVTAVVTMDDTRAARVELDDPVLSIGYIGFAEPSGFQCGADGTAPCVSVGQVINSLLRYNGAPYISTSARLVEGMSGGPLVYASSADPALLGVVIGIADQYPATAEGYQGRDPNFNYVVPATDAVPYIKTFLAAWHTHL